MNSQADFSAGAAGPDLTQRLLDRLVEQGLVKEADLARVSNAATERELSIQEALVAMGVITEDQAGAVLADLLGLPYVFPHAKAIDRELLGSFPKELLHRHKILPLVREGDRIVMATPVPPGKDLLRDLEAAGGAPVSVSLASARRVERTLTELLGPPSDADRPRRRADDPSAVSLLYRHLARALVSSATEIRFEPDGQAIAVRYRIDGRLEQRGREPLSLLLPLVARVQLLLSAPAPAPGVGMHGSLRTLVGERELVVDIAILPTRSGESILLRLIPSEQRKAPAPMDERNAAALRHLTRAQQGLVIVASADHPAAKRISYVLLRTVDVSARVVVTVEREALEVEAGFRQLESRGQLFDDGISWALGYQPDVLFVGEPPERREDLNALLAAAAGRLIIAASADLDAAEATIGWLERGARPSVLARVLRALVTVEASAVRVMEPAAALRQAVDRGGPPADIRRATREGGA